MQAFRERHAWILNRRTLLRLAVVVVFVVEAFIIFDANTAGWTASGVSMHHGSYFERDWGIINDRDIMVGERVHSKDDIRTFVSSRLDGYRVAGDYGDILMLRDRFVHRAIVWVEFNATSGMFDVPELGLTSVFSFNITAIGYFDRELDEHFFTMHARGKYVRGNMTVHLGWPDATGAFEYPAGNHSGFLTKGDWNPFVDQEPIHPNETTRIFYSKHPIIRPEWIGLKLVRVIDREFVDAGYAAIAVFAFAGTLLTVRSAWQNRGRMGH